MNTLDRLSRIASRAARRYGASAAVYASGKSFDVLTERQRRLRNGVTVHDGMAWVRSATEDAYRTPRKVALAIRNEMQRLWA